MVVEINNLVRHFGKVRAVDGVSFRFASGEVCGFIGPNGAGKTTAMRILATLDVPDHGDASFDGLSVIDYPDRVRPRIGFMPDYYGTYPDLTVTEYLDFFARTYKLRGRKRSEAIRSVMGFTELDKLAEKDTRSLSKGMRQRLSLARALINDPDVLILDEPAAGLDPRARIELRALLTELAADGKAILISSHILRELGEMCGTVVIIERGRIRAAGPLEQIKQRLREQRASARTAQLPVAAAAGPADPGAPGAEPPAALPVEATQYQQRVRIQLLGQIEQAEKFLHEQPDVDHIVAEAAAIVCDHLGDGEQLAGLLARLVGAGLPVVGFQVQEEDLEDLFMALTDGDVQ